MLSRLCRFASRAPYNSSHESEAQGGNSIERTLYTLRDDANYTAERAFRVVRGLYFLYNGSRAASNRTRWAEDEVVISSVKKLTPLVSSLTPEQVNTLIRNLSFLKIRDFAIWEAVENAFVEKSHQIIEPNDLPYMALNFANLYRKNARIWNLIEDKILKEVYPEYQFTPKGVADLFFSFNIVRYGSEALYEGLKNNAINTLESATIHDVSKIIAIHSRIKFIEPEFLDALMRKFESFSTSELNSFICFNVLEALIHTNADLKYTKSIEEKMLKVIGDIKLTQVTGVISLYGKKISQDAEGFADRKSFVETITKHYLKNEKELKSSRSNESNWIFIEIKIFWGLSKLDINIEPSVWKAFAKRLSELKAIPETESLANMKTEVEAYIQERKLN